MKTAASLCFMAASFLAVTIPSTVAQEEQEHGKQHHHYKLIELGTFGGPNSYFTFVSKTLNNGGLATGSADTSAALNPPFCLLFPDCFVARTFLWKDGRMTDLGALPGIGASFPNDINASGVVAGLSLNGGSDPVIGVPFFNAVVFKDGKVINLGTFGGPLSYAAAVNDQNQVVGFALNSTPDSFDLGDFCENFPMPTQMRAFIWQSGVKKNLGTLGGTDSCALFINDRGQVAGNSFTNDIVNPGSGFPTTHPFFWDGNEMRDLKALGAGNFATASAMNGHGQVAGISNLADDFITFHAFLWDDGKLKDFGGLGGNSVEVIGLNDDGEFVGKADLPGSQTHDAFLGKNGALRDLGTQDGDPCSVAISINSKEQIVGGSSDCSNSLHAFLWEDGRMTDLNVFVPPSATLTLTQATFVDDRGEITAEGVLPNGDQRAVLLIPCNAEDEGCIESDELTVAATAKRMEAPGNSAISAPRHPMTPSERAAPWRAWFMRRFHIGVE
jgi:probable HAF family extracellular repeat protein